MMQSDKHATSTVPPTWSVSAMLRSLSKEGNKNLVDTVVNGIINIKNTNSRAVLHPSLLLLVLDLVTNSINCEEDAIYKIESWSEHALALWQQITLCL